MTFEEYRRCDALDLARLIRKKEITAAEAEETAIQRAEQVNPRVNAIVHPLYDLARKMAGEAAPGSPFAGVPFLIKDLGLSIKDTPRRTGSKGYEGYVSPENSYAVLRFRAASLSFLGKTHPPEFGLTPFANMTGQPSMSAPLHWTADNLPVGLMFTGPIGREDMLFQLAAQLEEAQPWMDKVAPV